MGVTYNNCISLVGGLCENDRRSLVLLGGLTDSFSAGRGEMTSLEGFLTRTRFLGELELSVLCLGEVVLWWSEQLGYL